MEEKMTIQQETVSAFINKWITLSKPESILLLKIANWNTFLSIENPNIHTITQSDSEDIQSKYDLIIGDLPIGMTSVDYEYRGEKLRIPRNRKAILHSLDCLKENGTALYVIEPLGFGSELGKRFEALLNKNGFFVSAHIRLPEGMFRPQTSLVPIIAVITKQEASVVFVDELKDPIQAKYLVDEYFYTLGYRQVIKGLIESAQTPLPEGIRKIRSRSDSFIPQGSFQGFSRLKIQRQIDHLETQYKTFTQHMLGDLSIEINTVPSGGTFVDKANSIYIPRIGKSPVVGELKDTTLKHQNYFQVVLNQSVNNAYMVAFFRSALGKLVLSSAFSDSFIPHVNKSVIENLLVTKPKPEEQLTIVNTINKLSRLESALTEFDSELALNPTNSSSIQERLDSMLDAINKLTEVEKINALVRKGETEEVEFKQTFCLNIDSHMKDEKIETSALKTVVAFINTNGGNLLIGVCDEPRVILGINQELERFHWSLDKYMLHWKDMVKKRIGERYYLYIHSRIVEVNGNKVFWIECKPSEKLPCFLDNKDFYIRTNPATDKLEGTDQLDYLKTRFPEFF